MVYVVVFFALIAYLGWYALDTRKRCGETFPEGHKFHWVLYVSAISAMVGFISWGLGFPVMGSAAFSVVIATSVFERYTRWKSGKSSDFLKKS